MTTSMWTRRLRAAQADDAGFSLIEITVAMMVMAVGLLGLMGVQVRSLSTVALAGQRQAAAQLANRAMEQMRALPYGTVTGGMVCSDLAGDANVVLTASCAATFKPAYDSTISEAVVTQTGTGSQVAPLFPHRQPTGVTKIGNIQYDVRAYVTRVNADPTVDQGYWLTVTSAWASAATGGTTKSLATRSRLYSPTGCLATTTHPFSGPCQAFHYSDASTTGGKLSVLTARAGPIVDEFDVTEATATSFGASTRLQSEQVVSAQSQTVTSGASLTGTSGSPTSNGGAAGSSVADTNPATGATSSPTAATTSGPSGATALTSTGTGGTFSVVPDGVGTGSALSTVESTTSPVCADDAGTAMANGQACASAGANAGEQISSVLQLTALDLNVIPIVSRPLILASLAPSATPSRAWGGRFLTGTAAHCTNAPDAAAPGVGCAGAGVTRSLGDASAGGLATLTTGDIIRNVSGVDVSAVFASGSQLRPLVSVTGYTDTAQAEGGLGVRTPVPAPSRTGTLTYWNGTDFTSVNLASSGAATYDVPLALVTYQLPVVGSKKVVEVSGSVTVTAPSSVATGASPCAAAACDVKVTAGSVVTKLNYTVKDTVTDPLGVETTTVIGKFTVTLDLGAALANTTYKAAPVA